MPRPKLNQIVVISLFISVCLINCLKAGNPNKSSLTIEEQKAVFLQAKQKIESMLAGKEPLDYEKAVYLTESAYNTNQLEYESFKDEISIYTQFLELIVKRNSIKKETDFQTDIKGTSQEKYAKYQALIKNWVIYKFLADTTYLIDSDKVFTHYPFSYSTKDPLATNDWKNSQVFNLLFSDNETGNCYALASLFKIFAERLGTDAQIATAPNHIYIVHKDDKGILYNIELGSRAFPGNGSIETLTYLTDKAVKNDLGMRYLDLRQSVALNLVYLAKGYQTKFGASEDDFLLDCANTALQYDKKNLNALLLKAEVAENRLFAKLVSNNISSPKQLSKLPKLQQEFQMYEEQIVNLYDLGYLEMPVEMKNLLISAYLKDNSPILHQNHTPTANSSSGTKHDEDYITLSNGLFDEMHMPKPLEKYSRVILDTKTKKIIEFVSKDTTYNKYNFDPVLFALSIDPLASKYPYYSPYSAFGNNPILYVDNDGQENIIYLVNLPDKSAKTKKVDAYQVAKEANDNFKKMGLKTRVVVVDQSVTGKAAFDASKIDKTDAVAVIGNVKDVTAYIKNNDKTSSPGYEANLDAWPGGSGHPELSENFIGGQGDGNKRGGDFIAIDVNGLGSTNDALKTTNNQAAGLLVMHGAGHNAEDNDKTLDHQPEGVMVEDISSWKGKTKDNVISVGSNKSFISHIKERFGTKDAKVNYNGKGTVIK